MRRPASRRGWSCGRGSTACRPGWAPASPLADSAAAQPGSPPRSPASRPRSDQSGNLKSHNTDCLLIENDEQMAIACVGMADVNIQITLGISGEVHGCLIFIRLPKA